ncbi:MAG: Gfo/Idh/MocA family protein [Saccharofermentanales bacterium]|jgi:predicted dehydrogenase
MNNKVKVGIIGCGSIAKMRHVPEYLANPNSIIVGVFDSDPKRAKALAETSDSKVYGSIEELLNDPEINAVSVCTSNDTHADITIQALKKGKHVLCEKPMATSLDDCLNMGNVSKQENKILMVGHNQRFTPAHVKAKELLESNVLGEVITFKTNFGHRGPEYWSMDKSVNTWFFDKNKASMGVSADLGIHKIDLIMWLLDDTIDILDAMCVTLDKRDSSGSLIQVDDNMIVLLKMNKGQIGTITTSWTYYGSEDNSTILYCTNGIMRLYDNLEFPVEIEFKNGESAFYKVGEMQTNEDEVQANSGVIDDFVEAIVNDKTPSVPYTDAIEAMKSIFACIESSNTGKRIQL